MVMNSQKSETFQILSPNCNFPIVAFFFKAMPIIVSVCLISRVVCMYKNLSKLSHRHFERLHQFKEMQRAPWQRKAQDFFRPLLLLHVNTQASACQDYNGSCWKVGFALKEGFWSGGWFWEGGGRQVVSGHCSSADSQEKFGQEPSSLAPSHQAGEHQENTK